MEIYNLQMLRSEAVSNKSNVILMIAALFILTSIIFTASTLHVKSISKESASLSEASPRASLKIEDFKFSFPVKGGVNRTMSIKGKRLMPESKKVGMFRTDAIKVLRLVDAEAVLYDSAAPLTRISSKSATLEPRDPIKSKAIDALTGTISFSGGVTVFTQDKSSLTCRKLELDQINGRIRAEGGCILLSGGKRVKVEMIDTDILLRDYSVRKDRKRPIDSMSFVAMFR